MAHDLSSLITVLDGLLRPTDQEDRILDYFKKAVLESLLEKATSLKYLLEKSVTQHHLRGNSGSRYKEMIEALQCEIREVAREAEDIIESHAVDQMLSKHNTWIFLLQVLSKFCRFFISRPDYSISIHKVMEQFEAANVKLREIIEDDQCNEEETTDVVINPSSFVEADPASSKPNTAMVGFDDDAIHLKDRLTSQRRQREIIPIVGMGGIGKTTLARNLYSDALIVSHFDARAWVTVSQDYNGRAIILGLLDCIFGNVSDDMLQQNDIELGLTLYQRLCGRRYLLVLDDVWSEKVWDEVKHCFPNEDNRSRILITSRELDVAKYPDSSCEEHRMHLLSHTQGWELLRQKVFDSEKEEQCPTSLEEIGHKIVRDCGGLPLAISVIGGLLSDNKYSKDLWENVAEDVSSVLSHRDEHFSKILCLSYDNLPLHLKPCFLYMSAFPEDFEVKGSKLIKLWVAEGFLWRPSGSNKSLEDVAEEYLKALVDRNLILVARIKSNGRPESYSMHDLLRDLCVKKADEEKAMCIVKNEKVPEDILLNSFRRVSVHLSTAVLVERLPLSRSLLICIDARYHNININHILSTLRLVRVLDVYSIHFNQFPTELLQLFNLRFLAVTFSGTTPSGICRLRNLQTLLVGFNDVILPDETWEILGLRHIIVKNSTIYTRFVFSRVQENLQTIVGIYLFDLLASNLVNSMPNVKKLGIRGHRLDLQNSIIDLSHLHKLETLKMKFFMWDIDALSQLKLPSCLKKVTLIGCTIPTRLVNNAVGALEHLQVLKIRWCKFLSDEYDDDARDQEEWELHEGVEFCLLQYLELQELKLVRWKADDSSQFPRLKHLKIRRCDVLEEIPTSIGEISTLEMIVVDGNNLLLVDWAKEIWDIQRYDYGNESLQVRFS